MKFVYELSGSGWADGFIEIESNNVCFTASYLTDALDDLLRCLISIIPECVPYPQNKTVLEFDEEPAGTEWTFERIAKDTVSVKIVRYEDLALKESPVLELDSICPLTDLAKAVLIALDILLEKHGVDGYKKRWVLHDFPMNLYLRLKNFLEASDK